MRKGVIGFYLLKIVELFDIQFFTIENAFFFSNKIFFLAIL